MGLWIETDLVQYSLPMGQVLTFGVYVLASLLS